MRHSDIEWNITVENREKFNSEITKLISLKPEYSHMIVESFIKNLNEYTVEKETRRLHKLDAHIYVCKGLLRDMKELVESMVHEVVEINLMCSIMNAIGFLQLSSSMVHYVTVHALDDPDKDKCLPFLRK